MFPLYGQQLFTTGLTAKELDELKKSAISLSEKP
jgi:hypothetical protein